MTMKMKGYVLALVSAIFWGISGTFSQFLIQEKGLSPEWLITIRLLISGFILLAIPLAKNRESLLAPLKNKKDLFDLILFGIIGMISVQYTFLVTIKYSNAATATILQYLGPVFIACYYSIKNKRLPVGREILAIILAMAGTFFIVTHGSFSSLSISLEALLWGLTSAVGLAAYSIIPVNLLKKYDASVVTGWGMLLGGIAFSFIHSPFDVSGVIDQETILFTALTVLLGSTTAFYTYLLAVRILGPTITSLLACAEPLSAAIIAVIWLKVPLGVFDWLGMACILITIGMLTMGEEETKALT